MAATVAPQPRPISIPTIAPIPVRQIVPYAILGGLLFLMFLYFVAAEQGAGALVGGNMIHELFHDGRHLLGFPCH